MTTVAERKKDPRTLFDAAAGEELKKQGMQKAEDHNKSLLSYAQAKAVELALQKEDRTISADDVMLDLISAGIPADGLGPAAGGIFRGKAWEFTGQWIKSKRVSNHARQQRLWKLK